MRLIDADALINMVHNPYQQREIARWINDVPTVKLELQWIPCSSEKMPEVGQSVLMSIGGMYTAEGNLREDGNWSQYRWDAVQKKDMVEAWMPLPGPWKGNAE